MPSTIDNRVTARGVKGAAGFVSSAKNTIFVLEKTLDFATNVNADGTAYTNTSGDTLQLIDVPAKSVVLGVYVYVETAMGSAGTMKLGDGDDDDGYIASLDLNTPGIVKADGALFFGTDADVTGAFVNKQAKAYASAGIIAGVLGGTLTDHGKIHISVLCMRLGA